jgi:FkbM family methyltransferase
VRAAAPDLCAVQGDLIMDVGMHDGTDTAYYLSKGFRVVAIEANPALAGAAEERFSAEIAEGRLEIVAAAITETRGVAPMAVADSMTIWSSVDPGFIERNRGVDHRYVQVPTIPFQDVLSRYGIPYFLKVDIEGNDMLPVRALHEVGERPRFVSIESSVTAHKPEFRHIFDELARLWALGYRRFKYVNQRRLARIELPREPLEGTYVDARFEGHSSGPFGRETPGRWLSVRQALVKAEMLRARHNLTGYGGKWSDTRAGWAYASARAKLVGRSSDWYDLHARLGE